MVKTIIIKEVLCVGFVGVLADLEEAHSNILDFFLHREVDRSTFQELLSEYDFNKYTESAILFSLGGMGINKSSVLMVKFGNWKQQDHPFFQTMFSAGTGTSEWENGLIERASYFGSNKPFYPVNSLNLALVTAMKYLVAEKSETETLCKKKH